MLVLVEADDVILISHSVTVMQKMLDSRFV